MKRVVTFGEIMLRLSPPGFERLFQSPLLSSTFGGGERLGVSFAETGASQPRATSVRSSSRSRSGRAVRRAGTAGAPSSGTRTRRASTRARGPT